MCCPVIGTCRNVGFNLGATCIMIVTGKSVKGRLEKKRRYVRAEELPVNEWPNRPGDR
jgi:hypothetical protein